MVLFVSLEVFSEIGDALAEQRNLYLRRTGVGLVGFETLNDFLLLLSS